MLEAKSALDQAEQDLIAFQSANESEILQVQLDDKKDSLRQYLQAVRSLGVLVQDAELFRARLSFQDSSARISFADELTTLLLQASAQNTDHFPIELQITGSSSWNDTTVGERIVFLDLLIQRQ